LPHNREREIMWDPFWINSFFVAVPAFGFALLLRWSFKNLPRERWQIMASVPVAKEEHDRWRAVNLTYYGLLSANAYASAAAILLVLMASVSVSLAGGLMLAAALLLLCVPASKLVARLVEKKAYTFTVGGAVFVGMLAAPWIIWVLNMYGRPRVGMYIPVLPTLAALSIAYAFGEGLGRLACISFGCCYGKALSECRPFLRRLFARHSFTFLGKTKKIAYASGLDGEKVIPVQAMTSVLYVGVGLVSTFLYLSSRYAAAFVLSTVVTQGWRSLSETLRADYRGEGRISAYQVMAVAGVVYSLAIPILFPAESAEPPDLAAGLKILWNPATLLFLQALWLAMFLYTGRSMVTGSTLSLYVHKDRT
jgi:hypothetical protein